MKFILIGSCLPNQKPEDMMKTAKALHSALPLDLRLTNLAVSSDFRTVFAMAETDDAAALYRLAAETAACLAFQIHTVMEFKTAQEALGSFQETLSSVHDVVARASR